MLIIGITGTNGAGKGTVVDYLVGQKGFTHFSAREFITEEVERRKLSINRDNLVVVGNDLRSKFGPSYIVECLFERAQSVGGNCIIESLRAVGEVISLRSKGEFVLLAINADRKIRYDRIILRESEKETASFEEFAAGEDKEMYSNDPNKQNLRECMAMADRVINNDKDKSYLINQIEEFLDEFNKKK